MSSSTATISSKTSSVNANDRKRSIRSSPSPPLMKRNGLVSTASDQSRTNSERTSRSTQQIQTMDDQRSSSTDSNHSTVSLGMTENKIKILVFSVSIRLIFCDLDSNSKPPAIIYDSEEDFQATKPNSMFVSSTASKKDNVIIQQLTKPRSQSNSSTKLVKLVAPQSTSSIKMLSSDGGFTSALRIPTRIQLTKTLHSSSIKTDIINQEQMNHFENLQDNQQTVAEYHSSTATLPPTPPPPVIDSTNANIEISEQQTQDQQQQQQQQQQQHNDTNDETKEKLTNNNNQSKFSFQENDVVCVLILFNIDFMTRPERVFTNIKTHVFSFFLFSNENMSKILKIKIFLLQRMIQPISNNNNNNNKHHNKIQLNILS